MSKTSLRADTDDQTDDSSRHLMKTMRSNKKSLVDRINEFEQNLKNEEKNESDVKSRIGKAVPLLAVPTSEDEKASVPSSSRSNQRLITSDEEARQDVIGRRRRTRKARETSASKKNTDMGTTGEVNEAFDDTLDNNNNTNTNDDTTTKNPDESVKKPRKRTRRARKMTEINEEVKDPNILAVIIHRTDKLRTDVSIYQPVVRIHLVDLDQNGQYVKKTKRERNVLYYYEKENKIVDYVSPIMTSPFDFKENRSIIPRWEERVVFNEEFSHFIQERPNVVILFEILDSLKYNDENDNDQSNAGKNWRQIAWAFLKLVGSDKSLNIDKKIRLQLYYPQRDILFNLGGDSLIPEVYNSYNKGMKLKYPGSLHVTVKPIHPSKQFYLGIGSAYMINEEMTDENVDNMERRLMSGDEANLDDTRDANPNAEQDEKGRFLRKKTVIWSRLPGQPCNVPNELSLALSSTKNGCYSIKFSTSGSYLACACIEEDNSYPILVYEIPEGRFYGKFYGHFGIVYEINWSNLDKYFVTASHDATARVFDLEKKGHSKETSRILPHPSFVYSAKFHPNSMEIICTSCFDKVIRIWFTGGKKKKNQKYGELLQELTGHYGYINSISFSNDGNYLFTADSVGLIKKWFCTLSNEPQFKQWTFADDIEVDELKNQCINFIQLHLNRFGILVQTRDNQLKLIDTRAKLVVQRYKGTFNFSHNLKTTMTPCCTFLFNSGADTKIYCWNVITGDLVATPISLNYLKPARDIDFHPFDNYIAFCSYENKAPIYIFKYNPDKAMREAVQINSDAYLSDVQIEGNQADEIARMSEYEDKPHSARMGNNTGFITINDSSKRPEFKYNGPKEYKEMVIAIYDYSAQRNDELDFVKGDEIIVLVRENENWCLGELVKTRRQGYFPANYVQDKSLYYERNTRNRYQTPKYSVKDVLSEYQKVYHQDGLGLLKANDKNNPTNRAPNPNTNPGKGVNPRSPDLNRSQRAGQSDSSSNVEIVNEIPTRDGSNITSKRRDRTSRRTFAHVITGSHLTSSEI